MTSTQDSDASLVTDEMLSAVANDRRRTALRVLHGADGAVAFDTLANNVIARVRATEGAVDPKEVRTVLHHVHLPVLDESGLIDYDTDAMEIRPVSGDLSEAILSLFDGDDGSE